MAAVVFKTIYKSETGQRKGSRRSYPLLPNKVNCIQVASGLTIDKMAKEILLPQGAELAKRPRRLNSQDAQNMEEAMPFSDMASG